MLSGVWFLSVLTVAGILQTESRKTAKDICKIRCLEVLEKQTAISQL